MKAFEVDGIWYDLYGSAGEGRTSVYPREIIQLIDDHYHECLCENPPNDPNDYTAWDNPYVWRASDLDTDEQFAPDGIQLSTIPGG